MQKIACQKKENVMEDNWEYNPILKQFVFFKGLRIFIYKNWNKYYHQFQGYQWEIGFGHVAIAWYK